MFFLRLLLMMKMKALFPANLMQGDKDHPKITPHIPADISQKTWV
jgi:hypothetical protein